MVNEGKKEATPNNMYNRIRGCWHQMPRSCPRTEIGLQDKNGRHR